MDRELTELHRGAREERKRLADDPGPCEPPRSEERTCDWNGCDALPRHRRHGVNGTYLDVCDQHRHHNGRGEPEGNAPL